MKPTFLKSLICACVAWGATACTDIDDLRRDVDDLEHRVTALETQIRQLNDNVAALQTLMNGSTVHSVTEADGVYTVTLSNGEVLTLTQGSQGGYIEPKIAIDDEGYWIISVRNDGQFERMKDPSGNDVRAVARDGQTGDDGNDGSTPRFRVDADNYWQVSYNDGTDWEYVLNGDQKVKADTASGSTDPFFANVEVQGDKLVLTLLEGGTAYEIPIYAGFKCIISGASEVVEFDYNASKTFDVDMDGVETTIVTAPAGWTAELTAKAPAATPAYTLKVTAPAPDAANTRATADSRTDVSILAVAANGLSTIAKLGVTTTGTVLHQPSVKSVTVSAEQTTENSLTFSVVTDDATGWKYICQPSSETAPDANKVMAEGTAGTDGPNTVGSLTKNTAYTIYVVAYHGSTPSALNTTEARTLKGVTDYYEEGVTLGGKKYDKNTGDVQLIQTATTISKSGVYFIDVADDVEITLNKLTATELVLIGRSSDKRPKVKLADSNTFISLGSGAGFILKNIEIVPGDRTGYFMNFNSGSPACENLIFEDCKITTPKNAQFSNFNIANGTIKNVLISNSVFCISVDKADANVRILNFANSTNGGGKIAENGTVTFRNSIFYAKDYAVRGGLLFCDNANQEMPTVAVSVTNCSLINYIGNPNYFALSKIKSVTFSKNILYNSAASTNNTKSSYTFNFLVAFDTDAPTLEYTDNIGYGLTSNNWNYFQPSSKYSPTTGSYPDDTDPFASKDFEKGLFVSGVAGYGATIE